MISLESFLDNDALSLNDKLLCIMLTKDPQRLQHPSIDHHCTVILSSKIYLSFQIKRFFQRVSRYLLKGAMCFHHFPRRGLGQPQCLKIGTTECRTSVPCMKTKFQFKEFSVHGSIDLSSLYSIVSSKDNIFSVLRHNNHLA